MGQKLCRLEQIRRVTAPWQQKAIDDAAVSVRLMTDNIQDAIDFLNEYQSNFWEPDYRHNVNNVLHESGQLSQSLRTFEQYATIVRLVLAMLAWTFWPESLAALKALTAKNTVPAGSLVAFAPASVLLGGMR